MLGVLFSLFLFIPTVNATEIKISENNNVKNILKTCEYSQEYLDWLDLSEEEKANTVMPPVCSVSKEDVLMNSVTSYSLKSNTSGDIPEYFSLIEEDRTSSVKDQQDTGACWTFAANAVTESYLMSKVNIEYDLSERHMEYATSKTFLNDEINPLAFSREVDDGGNFYLASAYLTNKQGPVLESEMPFLNNTSKIALSEVQNKTVAFDVNDIMISSSSTGCSAVASTMKEHLMNNGALAVAIYMTGSSSYYNSTTNALYYNNSSSSSNHAVTIVGWDDNYSKSNFAFSNQPSSDGAWI